MTPTKRMDVNDLRHAGLLPADPMSGTVPVWYDEQRDELVEGEPPEGEEVAAFSADEFFAAADEAAAHANADNDATPLPPEFGDGPAPDEPVDTADEPPPAPRRRVAAQRNAERLAKIRKDENGRIDVPYPWMREMLWVKRTEGKGDQQDEWYEPKSCTANANTILTHDERWRGVLARNDFAEADITRRAPPWARARGRGRKGWPVDGPGHHATRCLVQSRVRDGAEGERARTRRQRRR